ncbi:MAG: hypothetical protein COV91_05670 [Candidatus Taylorbacteria bacterium CG11_big_fil_rev_8_21_14_0_20_46_11]|uniref:Nudix hydrolase domain-containing protein n=1 Tax=Candidatus Taylorbacteria bacterium CG11_big_fil_rev_8_21_14_0_20_46_11 TaxID=1975025 RepID=A0A2H0KA44_9BACT|nr:MAG: hypothetical protein COV91_05670 [Candidatus Taylorbacteria bacterium CG11_big_fil_rev_8_21_14_0_20_46_11]
MTVSHDSETPAHGKQVITACAFIHRNISGVEQVFSAKRASTKKFLPNVWELIGGHIEFGEDIVEGLKREALEELGMETEVGDPFAVFSYFNKVKGCHAVQINYFAKFVSPVTQIRLDPEYHSEWRWFSEVELLEAFVSVKDDSEMLVAKKGFALLRGEKPNLAE